MDVLDLEDALLLTVAEFELVLISSGVFSTEAARYLAERIAPGTPPTGLLLAGAHAPLELVAPMLRHA